MPALSFKLSDPIVDSLRIFSKRRGMSQTKIIEASIVSWLEQEQKQEQERQFRSYAQGLRDDPMMAREESDLSESSISEAVSLLTREHA